jgi:hypothetical protein
MASNQILFSNPRSQILHKVIETNLNQTIKNNNKKNGQNY